MNYSGCAGPRCGRYRIKKTGSVQHGIEALRRIKAGWSQEKCPDCSLYTIWLRPSETESIAHYGSWEQSYEVKLNGMPHFVTGVATACGNMVGPKDVMVGNINSVNCPDCLSSIQFYKEELLYE